jgi:tetratricopeptide (TPR) repeat protein
MRGFYTLFLVPFLASAAVANAAPAKIGPTAAKPGSTAADPTPNERLDKLFGELKRERNEQAAQRIARRIADLWSRSGSATVDLLMQWSNDAMQAKKYPVALDLLDQVIALDPAYAEGWNRRATVHFLMDDYKMSMADIDKTLQLEPRHFGALAGMAQILQNTGRKKLALDAYERVLAIYPMMRSAQAAVSDLSEDLEGERI